MLVNYVPGEECRIALVRDGRLEEFYQERASAESHVGNIYKGKVTNVEPSIQAAFVDFGLERNGFLHISDLHPMYFQGKDREEFEQVGSKTPHRDRPPIQKCLRRGQDVLVQVLKEGIGTKGPTLTSYLSIPGRFLVMMPHMQRMGVSRKVEDDDVRREMRQILAELNPPEGFGFIIRTAGLGQTKSELKRDLAYLQRLWRNIDSRMKRIKGTGELYTESDLVIRTIRDVFTTDISRIVVDDVGAARRAHEFLTVASPRSRSKVVYYNDPVPLFHRFDIESQIESINSREVPLPSGGSLVIDPTEALVAIDVNSGKSRDARDAETNAYKTNMEAVDEICRQLRLRDLGGVIINDLIDMRDMKHRRQVEARLRTNLKRDRARTRTGSISQFGIMEMTRQRMRPSLKTSLYIPCPHCDGSGHTKSPESVVLEVMRRLALALHHEQVAKVDLTISPDVAFQLLNRKRAHLVDLEQRFGKPVMVRVGGTSVDYLHISAHDARGSAVDIEPLSRRENLAAPGPDSFVDLSGEGAEEFEELELAEEGYEEAEVEAADGEGEVSEAEEGEAEARAAATEEGGEAAGDGKTRRRRRRRRGRRGKGPGEGQAAGGEMEQGPAVEGQAGPTESEREEGAGRQEVKATPAVREPAAALERGSVAAAGDEQAGGDSGGGTEGKSGRRRRRSRRGRRRDGQGGGDGGHEGAMPPTPHGSTAPAGSSGTIKPQPPKALGEHVKAPPVKVTPPPPPKVVSGNVKPQPPKVGSDRAQPPRVGSGSSLAPKVGGEPVKPQPPKAPPQKVSSGYANRLAPGSSEERR
jgi:ribonuclease E